MTEISFRALRSGSAENCLLIKAPGAAVLIDCGFKTRRLTEQLLEEYAGGAAGVTAVLITHGHGDHVGKQPMKVFAETETPVLCHKNSYRHVLSAAGGAQARFGCFDDWIFKIGSLRFRALEVKHSPGLRNYGFIISDEKGLVKISVFTDFFAWSPALVSELADSDFIFIEANHDPSMLVLNPNPNSAWHMPNERTARLLLEVRRKSKKPPVAVMLGHLSGQRNKPGLAAKALVEVFEKESGAAPDFKVLEASRSAVSEEVRILVP